MWERGLEDPPFCGGLNTGHKWNSRVPLAVLLQEGDAEERKHILAELGHINVNGIM